MLVALLLLLVFTPRTTVVSIFSSISRPLVITIMTIGVSMVFINNPGVMANNTRMMITRLLFFMTIGLGHILALLNIGNIYNYFIINIALFMLLFLWDLVALLVLLVMTMRASCCWYSICPWSSWPGLAAPYTRVADRRATRNFIFDSIEQKTSHLVTIRS